MNGLEKLAVTWRVFLNYVQQMSVESTRIQHKGFKMAATMKKGVVSFLLRYKNMWNVCWLKIMMFCVNFEELSSFLDVSKTLILTLHP